MEKQKGFWVRVWHFGNGLKNAHNKQVKALGGKLSDLALRRKAGLMYLVTLLSVVCFLLALRMDNFVPYLVFATLSAFFAGVLATWYFIDKR